VEPERMITLKNIATFADSLPRNSGAHSRHFFEGEKGNRFWFHVGF
jgi:hypothetical protein